MPIPTPTDRRDVRVTDVDTLRRNISADDILRARIRSRPDPPRGVRFLAGTLRWDPPAQAGNVTHYNIYLNDEDTHYARVPVGQTSITGISAKRVFVSSWNDLSQRESKKVVLNEVVFPSQPRVEGVATHRELQAAIDALPAEGGEVYLAAGEWLIGEPIEIPATRPGVRISGAGDTTVIKRGADMASGYGVFNIRATNVVIANLAFDGDITTSTGIPYSNGSTGLTDAGGGNGDPMWSELTDNTSFWVHGGSGQVLFENVIIRHSGGYAILLDATSESISDVVVRNCLFENCRPHKFGDTGDLNYGAWTGGIHYQNDGVSPSTSKVSGLIVDGCAFSRMNGNCVWGHGYGFDVLHEDCSVINCSFFDIALDGVEPGNVIGGVVGSNFFRRVGFVHSTDVDTPTPAYRTASYAVGLDTTGYVRNVNYVNNTFMSVNGGFIDLDGYFEGTVSGNTLIMPQPGEDEYTEDQVASFGTGSGQITKGIQTNNSYYDGAARGVSIVGNKIRGCGVSAIVLAAARECLVSENEIWHDVNPSALGVYGVPILIVSTAATAAKQSANNVIRGNRIYWDISAPNINTVVPQSNYCILESDDATGVSVPGPNYVVDNICLGNNYGEFQKGATSVGTVARHVLPSNSSSATNKSESIIQREGFGASAVLKIYANESGTSKSLAQFQDTNAFLNLSDNGSAGTGGVVTGNRSSAAWGDTVFTGKVVGDAFYAIKKEAASGSTYDDADADLLDDTWALIRFASGGTLQQSITTSAGSRVWTALGGAGGTVAGSDKQVQFNDGGSSFGASANFTFDKTLQQVVVTGLTGTAGLAVATAFIQSAEGFYTNAVSAEAIKATGQAGVGASGVACRELNIYRTDGGATGWDKVIDGSRNADFNQVVAEATVGAIASAGNGTMSAQNGFYTPVVSAEAVKVTGVSGSGSGGVAARQYNLYRADGGTTGYDTIIDGSRNADFNQVVAETTVGAIASAGNGTMSAQNGFYTPSSSTNAINVPNGTIQTKYLYATDGIQPFTVLKQSDPDEGGQIVLQEAGTHDDIVIDNYQGLFRVFSSTAASLACVMQLRGKSGQAGLYLLNGWVDSAAGFLTSSAAGNAIQAPSGGATCATISGTSTAVNAVQASAGGVQSEKAIYLKTLGSNPTSPNSGYGGLSHKSGATYRYWNGSAWADVDLSATGGGSPGGSNTHIQFNNSGSFGGSSSLTWSGGTVGVSGNVNTSSGYQVGGVNAIDAFRNGSFLAAVVGTGVSSAGSGSVTAQFGFAVGANPLTGYNSIASFQNPAGGVDVKAVETDYLTLTPQASGIPSTVSGHTPSLKIWYNSASSRVEIGVSLYTPGISCEGNSVGGNNFRYWNGASYVNGASGSFTTNDGKTVTVNGGVITAIV